MLRCYQIGTIFVWLLFCFCLISLPILINLSVLSVGLSLLFCLSVYVCLSICLSVYLSMSVCLSESIGLDRACLFFHLHACFSAWCVYRFRYLCLSELKPQLQIFSLVVWFHGQVILPCSCSNANKKLLGI